MQITDSTGAPHVPHYRAIAAEIERRILAGEYVYGTLLPSEARLAQQFGVSRMTLRNALAALAAAGLIERRHGHGTLVAEQRFERDAQRRFVLSEELAAHGLRPGSHVLSLRQGRARPDERAALRLGSRAPVIRIERQRFADEVLIGYQQTVIPASFCPGLTAQQLEGASLNRLVLERYALRATKAELTIDAVQADERLASLLGIDPRSALLRVVRTAYLPDGRPLEKTVGWYPGERFMFRMDQARDSADLILRNPSEVR